MNLDQLTLTAFRNISELTCQCSAGFNIISGANGSGKTSFLEAIYYLSYLQSFRRAKYGPVIRHDQSWLCVYAEMTSGETLGVQRWRNGQLTARCQGQTISKAEMARWLPVVLINSDSYRLLEDGPEWRRRFMDWGMFHVKHDYLDCWRRYQKLMKQRNALLKNDDVSYRQIEPWDNQLVQTAHQIDAMRQNYVEQLRIIVKRLATEMGYRHNVDLAYQAGWNGDLLTVLQQHFISDKYNKFTQKGPHRADIEPLVNGKNALHSLSRGQQKVFVILLKLAQGLLLSDWADIYSVYLIDDLPSELDHTNMINVLDIIAEYGYQTFITAIEPEMISNHLTNDAELTELNMGEPSK